MTIKAILACDDYGGVSKKGTLPWPHNSTDLKWFKSNTVNSIVIMGSTTWEDPDITTWIIGGPNIIEQTLGVIDEFYLSRIPGAYACDTFLPLKKIESLFYRSWIEEEDDVTFEIWKKRGTK